MVSSPGTREVWRKGIKYLLCFKWQGLSLTLLNTLHFPAYRHTTAIKTWKIPSSPSLPSFCVWVNPFSPVTMTHPPPAVDIVTIIMGFNRTPSPLLTNKRKERKREIVLKNKDKWLFYPGFNGRRGPYHFQKYRDTLCLFAKPLRCLVEFTVNNNAEILCTEIGTIYKG